MFIVINGSSKSSSVSFDLQQSVGCGRCLTTWSSLVRVQAEDFRRDAVIFVTEVGSFDDKLPQTPSVAVTAHQNVASSLYVYLIISQLGKLVHDDSGLVPQKVSKMKKFRLLKKDLLGMPANDRAKPLSGNYIKNINSLLETHFN